MRMNKLLKKIGFILPLIFIFPLASCGEEVKPNSDHYNEFEAIGRNLKELLLYRDIYMSKSNTQIEEYESILYETTFIDEDKCNINSKLIVDFNGSISYEEVCTLGDNTPFKLNTIAIRNDDYYNVKFDIELHNLMLESSDKYANGRLIGYVIVPSKNIILDSEKQTLSYEHHLYKEIQKSCSLEFLNDIEYGFELYVGQDNYSGFKKIDIDNNGANVLFIYNDEKYEIKDYILVKNKDINNTLYHIYMVPNTSFDNVRQFEANKLPTNTNYLLPFIPTINNLKALNVKNLLDNEYHFIAEFFKLTKAMI